MGYYGFQYVSILLKGFLHFRTSPKCIIYSCYTYVCWLLTFGWWLFWDKLSPPGSWWLCCSGLRWHTGCLWLSGCFCLRSAHYSAIVYVTFWPYSVDTLYQSNLEHICKPDQTSYSATVPEPTCAADQTRVFKLSSDNVSTRGVCLIVFVCLFVRHIASSNLKSEDKEHIKSSWTAYDSSLPACFFCSPCQRFTGATLSSASRHYDSYEKPLQPQWSWPMSETHRFCSAKLGQLVLWSWKNGKLLWALQSSN